MVSHPFHISDEICNQKVQLETGKVKWNKIDLFCSQHRENFVSEEMSWKIIFDEPSSNLLLPSRTQ